jgi:hypothetical protein
MAFSQILWPGEIGYVQAFFDGTLAFSENRDTVPCSDLRSAAFFWRKAAFTVAAPDTPSLFSLLGMASWSTPFVKMH